MTDVPDGTPRALRPVAERVLAWVADRRAVIASQEGEVRLMTSDDATAERIMQKQKDDARAIELCALVTLDVAAFDTLYPGAIDATQEEVPRS